MNNDTSNDKDTIIDLDADQVVEATDGPAETATEKLAPKQSRRGGWLLAGVAIIAAAVGGGWLYKDVLSPYYPTNQTLALAEKMAAFESSNAGLREQLTATEKLAGQLKLDIDALEAKEATLSGLAEEAQKAGLATRNSISAIETALAETRKVVAEIATRPAVTEGGGATPIDSSALVTLQQRIDTLEKDVASLKAKPMEAPDNTAVLSQSLSDLKAKIAGGTGYRDEFERIQRLVPAAAGLDVLQQHAALGIPDAKGLAAELSKGIADLPKPIIPGPVPESEGWWASILESLSGLVTIKVEGDVDWPTAASAAAALADSGDLPQAMEQLNSVEGAKPQGIQQWLDRAQARLSLETALKSVEDAVLRVLAAKG